MKILRIDTKARTSAFEDLGSYAGLGGRALTSRMVRAEVPATCHALSEDNKLVIATGTLTGTTAANSGRVSVGGKSPLTGGIKEANSGGKFSQMMARLGIMAIVLEGKPATDAKPCVIKIDAAGVSFADAADLSGKGTYESCALLNARHGEKPGIMVIGPAGENLQMAASIQFTDPENRPARAAGRGGLGAVMGSKKVKAIVIDPEGSKAEPVADKEAFKTAAKRWAEILGAHPVTSQGLPGFGTAILVNVINEAGGLPTKNFRYGRFEHAAEISGEKMTELISARGGKVKEGCHAGCMIQCSQKYVDEKGEYITSGFEYETVWAMGANSLIKNLDDIARLDRACDDIGLDTIDMGCAIAVAMDAGIIPWGDGKAALGLLEKVRTGDPLGRIIGNGTGYTAQAFGIDRAPVVKNQSLPAYDPRAVKGIGVTYSTTPMGADHTAGYAVTANILKVGGSVDPLSKAGQVELSKNLQIATAAVDALGLCLFVAFAVLDTADAVQCIADMVAAKTGQPFTVDDVVALGINTLKDEIAFNKDAGFTSFHDQLPRFFTKEPLAPHNTTFDITVEEMQAAKVC